MAVSIILAPDALALTQGGRMRFQFQGSGRYQTLGTPAITVLSFTGAIPDGTVLNLRWNGATVSLIAKTNPSAANEFPAGDGSTDYARDILAPFFQSYFPFREDFVAQASNFGAYRGIVLTAKQPGPAYNVTRVNTASALVATPFPIKVEVVTPGADPILRDRYSVYVELWLQKLGSAEFERVHDGVIDADDAGGAEFDAGEELHALLAADLPDFVQNLPIQNRLSNRKYYVAYAEAFGQPIRVGKVQQDVVRQAYLGGGDFEHRSSGGINFVSFAQGPTLPEDRALRFGNRMRYVRPDQPEWLTFINTRAVSQQAGLLLQLTFDDNSKLNVTVQTFTFAPGDKWTLAVGPQQLNLGQYVPAGRSLTEYQVRLTVAGSDPAGNSHLSVAYRYVLAYNYEPYVRHFAYLNSLGCPDTLTTYGKGTHELQRVYKQAQRSLPADYSVTDAQFVDYDLSLQQQVEVTTGFREKTELRRWNDFYRSPIRLRVEGPRALAVGITSKSIKQQKDGDTLFAHRFEYVYLHKDEFYWEDLEPVGDPTPPAGLQVAGTPTITLATGAVVQSVDTTVPAAARNLTSADLQSLRQLAAVGLHTLAGYLKQATTDQLYYRQDQQIDYQTAVVNKPTTRDQAGLSDVPTDSELVDQLHLLIDNLIGFNPILSSWATDVEPGQAGS